MKNYAAMDAVVTFLLYEKMSVALAKNDKLKWVYDNILLEGCDFLKQVESNGVPFDLERLTLGQSIMQKDIEVAIEKLYEFPEVRQFEKAKGSPFNPNSTVQLRSLLYDYIGLTPTGKKTGTGADSTDAEVLGQLAQDHHVPELILEIRQKVKIKNLKISLESHLLLKTYCNKKGLKMFAFVEHLIKTNCKSSKDIYGE